MKNRTAWSLKAFKQVPSLLTIKKCRGTRYVAVVLAVMTLNLTQGCYYFKVNTTNNPPAETISSLDQQGKNFHLHFNEDIWSLSNVVLKDNNLTAEKSVSVFDYSQVDADGPNRYLKKTDMNQSYLLKDVHIYPTEFVDLGNNQISVPLSSISKVEVYDKHTAATTGSWVLGALGTAGAVYLTVGLIALIFKESCPFIYAYDGESYCFEGEIFSGAVQPGLERHDYLALPQLKPVGEQYYVKVTNEVREVQHINLLELAVIDHPEKVNVLMDKYGIVQTFSEPVFPEKAEASSGLDVLSLISEKDANAYLFNERSALDENYSGVVLTFKKPENASTGKLLIRAKNSLWVEHVYSRFHDLVGGKFDRFDSRQEKQPAEVIREKMISHGFPLSVYLENNGEWEMQDFYEIAGPMAMRNEVLAINLENVESETFQIKLETALMFWELDYAAMDFTGNLPLEIKTVSATAAIDENGFDVVNALQSDDMQYYSQPEMVNEANITFPVPGFTDENRSVILHSKGYYKIIREQEGPVKMETLKTFRNPGRMAQFSRELYEEFLTLSQKLNSEK